MASCTTPTFGGSTCPQVQLTVTQTASTDTTVTLSWTLSYLAHGYAISSSIAKSYTAVIAGTTVASGTFIVNGITVTKVITSGTKVIDKSTVAQTISFSCSMAFNITWGDVYGGTKSASSSISVPAKTSYTITYNANGGTGAPSPQTKWAGVDIKLSSTQPTKAGYPFQGWSTSSTGGVIYASGGTYSPNASIILYAVWKASTYLVTFNANGGTGGPTNQTKTHNVALTLSSLRPTRTNYTFIGWGTSPSSTTVAYNPGGSYTTNSVITLYAIWEGSYSAPRIINFTVDRCTYSGVLSEMGTYAKVMLDWATEKNVSSIRVEWKLESSSTYSGISVAGSGTSGSVNTVIGSGTLNTEQMYNVRVTVTDVSGSSNEIRNLSQTKYVIDFLAGGNGIAFGKPADKVGFDIGMPNIYIDGKPFIDSIYPVNSIYISYSHTSPASLFGGTWLRLSNRFLWACDASGTIGLTGGESTHVLTSSEMPSHTHIQNAHAHWLPYTANANGSPSMGSYVVSTATNSSNGRGYVSNLATFDATASNQNTGGSGAHNNLPPYMNVSVWRRTA